MDVTGEPMAAVLAGAQGQVVRLSRLGVRGLNRGLSAAEMCSLRRALAGVGAQARAESGGLAGDLVGYVCAGCHAAACCETGCAAGVIAVQDHANLTFRSPLAGPNEDSLGPRFPVVAGLYSPETACRALRGGLVGVTAAIVAEVRNRGRLCDFEEKVVRSAGIQVVTDELAAVAILAAHLGARLAAVVVLEEKGRRSDRT